MFEIIKAEIHQIREDFEELKRILRLHNKENRIREIEKNLSYVTDWRTNETKLLLKEKANLEKEIEDFKTIEEKLEELEVMSEIGEEEGKMDILKECEKKLSELKSFFRFFRMRNLMKDENDEKNAIMEINSGAGGTEAQDWAEMLMRMYLRWCEAKGFKTEIVDILPGEEAGVKSVTITIEGRYAYGLLKSETGVHRLVRISPFDANHRRHTSFVAVSVYPEIDEDIKVEIKDEDLKIETFRASGHGGQHVNKTDSAVRITHIPTGIVVQCQNERSQHRNKALAMKILKARLYELEMKKRQEEKEKMYASQKEIAWGSQIRSYVLHPYKMVKDHRTGYETPSAEKVLDGEIDPFIEAYLKTSIAGK